MRFVSTRVPSVVALLAALASCGTPEASEQKPAVAKADDKRPARSNQADEPPAALGKEDIGDPVVRVPIDGVPAFGSPSALVTIVTVGNHQCPYCARLHRRLETLRAEYGEKVRLVVVPHTLPMHGQADAASRAFFAAVEQNKGEAMNDLLYAKDGALADADLRDAAKTLGLDLEAFDRARNGPSTAAALKRAEELATLVAADGTPTTFVNGRRLVGARRIEAFRALVDEELGKARALVERGTPASEVYGAIMAKAPPAKPKADPALDTRVFDVPLDGAPVRGDRNAPVAVVMFSDFECPYCVKLEGILKTLEAERPGKVKVAFRHKPLPMHANARLAARASVAAEKQGRFWEYHDVLVKNRATLDRAALVDYAAQAGLSVARFTRDLDDASLDARIEADLAQAEKLDVKGTPTVFVNGRRITGAQPLATFLAEVDRALAANR